MDLEAARSLGPNQRARLIARYGPVLRVVVTDEGYQNRAVVRELPEHGVRTHRSEPKRGWQRWSEQEREQQALYANQRRIRG